LAAFGGLAAVQIIQRQRNRGAAYGQEQPLGRGIRMSAFRREPNAPTYATNTWRQRSQSQQRCTMQSKIK